MAKETVDLEFRANIAQLQADLAKVPGITDREAKKMVKALDSQLKRAEKSAKKAGKAGKKSFKDMSDAAGDADSVLQGLSASLDLVDPRLGAAARLSGDMAGGLEAAMRAAGGLGMTVAPIAAAVTALGGAWYLLNSQLDDANEKIERSRKELKDQAGWLEAVEVATINAAVATGDMSQAEADLLSQNRQVNAVFGDRIDLARDAANEATRAKEEAVAALADLEATTTGAAGSPAILAVKALAREFELLPTPVEEARAAVAEADKRVVRAEGNLRRLEGASSRMSTALQTFAENQRSANQETATAADSIEDLIDLEAEYAALQDQRAGAAAQLDKIQRDLTLSELDGAEKILFLRDEQLAQIRDLAMATGDLTEASETMALVEAQAMQQASDLAQKRIEETVAANAVLKAEAMDLANTLAASTADVFGLALDQRVAAFDDAKANLLALDETATQAQRAAALATLKETKAAAREMFYAQQNAAVASAIINGAIAVTRQYADLPLPAAIISSASIAALTAVEVATILSQKPTFHRGGVIGADPSERNITARAGEGVLPRQGVAAIGGPAGLAEANRGAGGGTTVLQLRVGNNVAQELVYQGTRGPGAGRNATRALRPRGRTNPYRTAN